MKEPLYMRVARNINNRAKKGRGTVTSFFSLACQHSTSQQAIGRAIRKALQEKLISKKTFEKVFVEYKFEYEDPDLIYIFD